MKIEEQFNLIAEEYDSNRRRFIPCFDDYYDSTTKFIVSALSIHHLEHEEKQNLFARIYDKLPDGQVCVFLS